MAEERQEHQPVSKYNAALAQQFRLDGLWQKFHDLILKGKLIASNWVLDRVWGELVADTKQDKKTGFTTIVGKFDEVRKDGPKLYAYLMEKEAFLREAQNKQGKGTAYVKEEEEDMD